MLQTKYFFLVVVVCIAVILGVGVWATITPTTEDSLLKEKEVIFSTPKDVYFVRPAEEDTTYAEREAFISKIRASLTDELRSVPEGVRETPTESVDILHTTTTTPPVQFGDGARIDAI